MGRAQMSRSNTIAGSTAISSLRIQLSPFFTRLIERAISGSVVPSAPSAASSDTLGAGANSAPTPCKSRPQPATALRSRNRYVISAHTQRTRHVSGVVWKGNVMACLGLWRCRAELRAAPNPCD
jgi:hypothetical protein